MKHQLLLFFLSLHLVQAANTFAPVLQPLIDDKIIQGATVLVVNKEKVLDLEAVGTMRKDNLFWIASMTKSITGTLMMMLVDEGRVSIDDPVEKYLPEFKGQMVDDVPGQKPHPPKHPITIREVLSHTSGLIRGDDKRFKKVNLLKDDIAQCAALPLLREPGTKYEYNNIGINTAGRIIEVVSGMPYVNFLQQRLLDPLGMKDTTFWPSEEQAGRLANTVKLSADKARLEEIKLDAKVTPAFIEKLSGGKKVPAAIITNFGFGKAIEYARQYGEPAGGLFSTAEDLGRFCRMLLNGGMFEGKRYLSENAIKQMTSSQTEGVSVSPNETYGLGWSVKLREDEGPSVGSFGHRGARKTAMWIDSANGLAMVLLVQNWDLTPEGQKRLYGSFMKAAIQNFGPAH